MGRLIKYIGYFLFIPVWWLQLLVPRNKNIWIFGAWYGNRYSDNSRYLYEYVKEHHPEIKAIWLTRSTKIKEQVVEKGGISYLTSNLKGIYYSILAKNVIICSVNRDVNYLFINGARKIQLWHGNPMKKIGLDDKFSPLHSSFQRKIVPLLFPFADEVANDYVVSNSEAFSGKMASAFAVPMTRVLETGCPRNDIFYSTETDRFNDNLKSKFKGAKLVYYLPTFRSHHGSKSLFTLPDYSLDELEAFLKKENLVFVSKGHYVDNQLSDKTKSNDSRLINLSDEDVSDINFMLKDADLLITDYSGAYFDFLLTQKPIILAAFDLEEYLSSSREMYFDYKSSVAGPIVKTWADLYSALNYIWTTSEYQSLLKEKNQIFNKYHDDQNSKRVFEAIVSF